jgi:hypothetical protein
MVKLQETDFLNWKNCLKLSNGTAELIVSVEVGPRIISYRNQNGHNFFKIFPEQIAVSNPDSWLSYGGHRLWHAPEVFPRTYYPDNLPVKTSWHNDILTLICPEETTTRLQKIINIKMDSNGTGVSIEHLIYNRNPWPVVFAPWCLTVMAAGGRAIIPQEPFVPHGEKPGESFEHARPLVLWQFTRMDDPRFIWGGKYIQFKEDGNYPSKQKIGITNKQGWAAYVLHSQLFLKRHDYEPGAVYPDGGCNAEFFTMPGFLEIESMGRLEAVAPNQAAILNEHWSIHDVNPSENENDIDSKLKGVI